mmetsp:Transcript_10200/g.32340  ORF Transcript_10200/g.32340 Transcript_10200/m.32340 type:complete len:87 (+) Transcript_10200:484-744(+)
MIASFPATTWQTTQPNIRAEKSVYTLQAAPATAGSNQAARRKSPFNAANVRRISSVHNSRWPFPPEEHTFRSFANRPANAGTAGLK